MGQLKTAFDLLSMAQPTLTGAAATNASPPAVRAEDGTAAFLSGAATAQAVKPLQDLATNAKEMRARGVRERWLGWRPGEQPNALQSIVGSLAGAHSYGKEVAPFMRAAEEEALNDADDAAAATQSLEEQRERWLQGFATHEDPVLRTIGNQRRNILLSQRLGKPELADKASEVLRRTTTQMQQSIQNLPRYVQQHKELVERLRSSSLGEQARAAALQQLQAVRMQMGQAQLNMARLREIQRLQHTEQMGAQELQWQKDKAQARGVERQGRLQEHLSNLGFVVNKQTNTLAGTGRPGASPDEPEALRQHYNLRA